MVFNTGIWRIFPHLLDLPSNYAERKKISGKSWLPMVNPPRQVTSHHPCFFHEGSNATYVLWSEELRENSSSYYIPKNTALSNWRCLFWVPWLYLYNHLFQLVANRKVASFCKLGAGCGVWVMSFVIRHSRWGEDKKYIIKTMSKRDGRALGPVINEQLGDESQILQFLSCVTGSLWGGFIQIKQ